MAWIDDWGDHVPGSDLRLPAAAALAEYVSRQGAALIEATGAYRNATSAEILTFAIQTGAPQRSVVPIRPMEPIGVVFAGEGATPLVLALREDFPDTEHQQLVPEGCPAAICIDDRPWVEARLTWTPAETVPRTAAWFHRAARGQLHDPSQPLDPFFGHSRFSFVFPRSAFANGTTVELAGLVKEAEDPTIVITAAVDRFADGGKKGRILPVAYRVAPERMKRMRRAPTTVGSLARFLSERGVDLISDLQARVRAWSGHDEEHAVQLSSRVAVIVDMPVIAPDGHLSGASDVRAFVTLKSVGEIGLALGILHRADSDQAASRFARAFPEIPVDVHELDGLDVELAQVHVAFDRERAGVLSGRKGGDDSPAVLVGAGAIGSHLAEYLAREGRFRWTVVDHDRLLPHNLARHTLAASDVGAAKATRLARRLNAIFDDAKVAQALDCDVLAPGDKEERLRELVASAAVVIDASASVAASRHLSDLDGDGRRASAFFNPAGNAAVILVEPRDRSLKLRDLEAQYYRAVLRDPSLATHLSAVGDTFAYTGACRAVTNRMPESRAAALSALAADGLGRALDLDGATMIVWTVCEQGVGLARPAPAPAMRHQLLGWEVSIDEGLRGSLVEMRGTKVPNETGGVLIGVVDAHARKIYLVEALGAPADSVESPYLFERGIEGLTEQVTALMAKTMDQVRYVGEWHSHPPRCSVRPSGRDLAHAFWLTGVLSAEAMPALMLIVGDDGALNVVLGEARPGCR